MRKFKVKSIKLISIKSKIIFNILSIVIVLSVTLGTISSFLSYKSTHDTLEQTMTETAKLASDRVHTELELYSNIAAESGKMSVLSDPNVTLEQKKKYNRFEKGAVQISNSRHT